MLSRYMVDHSVRVRGQLLASSVEVGIVHFLSRSIKCYMLNDTHRKVSNSIFPEVVALPELANARSAELCDLTIGGDISGGFKAQAQYRRFSRTPVGIKDSRLCPCKWLSRESRHHEAVQFSLASGKVFGSTNKVRLVWRPAVLQVVKSLTDASHHNLVYHCTPCPEPLTCSKPFDRAGQFHRSYHMTL